jgi:hypothetical protein
MSVYSHPFGRTTGSSAAESSDRTPANKTGWVGGDGARRRGERGLISEIRPFYWDTKAVDAALLG